MTKSWTHTLILVSYRHSDIRWCNEKNVVTRLEISSDEGEIGNVYNTHYLWPTLERITLSNPFAHLCIENSSMKLWMEIKKPSQYETLTFNKNGGSILEKRKMDSKLRH